jgi:hypothetical protein
MPDWLTFDDLRAVIVACLDLVVVVIVLGYDDQHWWSWALVGLLLANGVALVGARELGGLMVALTAFASLAAMVVLPVLLVLGWV